MEEQTINWAQWAIEQGPFLVILAGILFGFFKWGVPAIRGMSENFAKTVEDMGDRFIEATKEARTDYLQEMQLERKSREYAMESGRANSSKNFDKLHERIDLALNHKSNNVGSPQ